ncbi:MAG: GNAT family protein [Segetibacter sp.]
MQIKGDKTLLAEVTVEDAEIVCNLRNDKQINKYLSSSKAINIAEQQQWIIVNQAKNDGYYFKIIDLDTNECCGTISIYNAAEGIAEFGRYISTKSLQAIEAEYLILKFGFESFNLHKIYCRTAVDNIKVWKQHYKFGFKDAGEELLESRQLLLKVQEITFDKFICTDYSFIKKILERFQ